MSSRVLHFSPILAHPKLDTLRDIPLAIYWDICLNDDINSCKHLPSRRHNIPHNTFDNLILALYQHLQREDFPCVGVVKHQRY